MSLYAIWVPVLVASHILGAVMLLYSLEETSGSVSKMWRKKGKNTSAPDEERTLVHRMPSPLSRVDLFWTDVSCWGKTRGTERQLLYNCSGRAKCNEVLGILGPSGAGKSTLLEVLYGHNGSLRVQGCVIVNGRPAHINNVRRTTAYVTQQDCFVPTLSVLETVAFRAALTTEDSLNRDDIAARLEGVLRAAGIWQLRGAKVGGLLPGGIEVAGISGGEKRRLNIACALVSNPTLIFLDEPTSGLDSFAAMRVMDHVFGLAKDGRTIIASIHQPRMEIFNRLDRISLLSEGRMVYSGSPDAVVDWFCQRLGYDFSLAGHGSISDWLLDVISVGFDKDKSASFMTSVEDVERAAWVLANLEEGLQELDILHVLDTAASTVNCLPEMPQLPQPTARYAVSLIKQTHVLTHRALLAALRNPTDTASRLLLSTWIGTLTGLVFNSLPDTALSTRGRLSVLFYVLLVYQLLPFTFMSFYVADRRFFLADVKTGLYAPSAYFVASTTAGYPFVVLNTACGALMAYGLSGLRNSGSSIMLYVCCTSLQALLSQQLLIFCVWATSNQDMAYVFATGYVAFCILLSGYFICIADITISFVKALSWLNYSKYAMDALARIELAGRVWTSPCDPSQLNIGADNGTNTPLAEAVALLCPATGDQELSYYGYEVPIGTAVGAMLGFGCILYLGSFLALTLRVHGLSGRCRRIQAA